MRVLLTGATGFVGGALLRCLSADKLDLLVAVRSSYIPRYAEQALNVGNINAETDWSAALDGVDVVIHVAGLAHLRKRGKQNSLAAFRSINVDGTLALARQAVATGVRRFIFISSIGVNGYQGGRALLADDKPAPTDPYSQSKWEAEQGLMMLAESSALEVVIIRPPLVYGAGAPGNFGKLVRAVAQGVPLPFGAVHNHRTLVALENLVDLIAVCITHPAAVNQVFLAGDAEEISTTELLRLIARALNKSSRLLPIPVSVMEFGAGLLGQRDQVKKICGDLRVDISKAERLLGWVPPLRVSEALSLLAK